ncbi:aminoglycoside phosphotransferase family protein [Nocardioides anomalus]|uniref:Aminoglycoside phosphotransferase family protein n=1 Tax=Nocardioides anomalus TaxID=2712223 RepID=A0A6G6WM73_9ACTN|nr:aminoglycoside phosphotransferase family protein [Nocardioides anomalus]
MREQAPHLADLPVRPAEGSGSSNTVVRLGEAYAVRLPRSTEYAADLRKEVAWLPRLGPLLPAPVPEVVFTGRASDLFPHPWAVVTWVPGDPLGDLDASQQQALATDLGAFLQGLHALDTAGLTSGAQEWGYRCGEPVTATADAWVDEAADGLSDLFDPARVRRAWGLLRDVPAATTPACWVHTDLSAENLLVRPDGHLAGVIDFGSLGVGDRSVDLLYAWSLFDAPARETLRAAAGADAATWSRARAWAFAGPGLLTIAHYGDQLPRRTARLTAMVEAVAAEVGVDLR